MIQTAIWIPPALCGCQIRITGDFIDGSVVDGISYRHPKSFTITDMSIVSVCDDHAPQTKSMMDVSAFFDDPKPAIDGITAFLASKNGAIASRKPVQNRGYLKYPIDNPTPAQCLYTFLSQQSATVNRLPCGCAGYSYVDETNYAEVMKGLSVEREIKYIDHPLHTSHCDFHQNDTPDLQAAKSDAIAYQTMLDASATEITPQISPAVT